MGRALATALLVLAPLGAAAPSDPLAPQQWHLAEVGAAAAWGGGRGGGVVVAVLDTGVDLEHPDLRDRLVEGVDLVDEGTVPDDPQGHGTLVAGIIAATAGNGQGVAGVAPSARLMPVRVLDAEGRGTPATVAAGIRWAADHGASVINLSLADAVTHDGAGASGRRGAEGLVDAQVEQAIRAAAEAGVLVVVAAGNDGRDAVPYREDLPVLVVGATDRSDHVWPRSNRDARVLFAPGVEILSTWNGGRYAKADGTSFAAPIVAAGAAILRGQGLAAGQARARLVGAAVRVGSGLGRVDLAAAVTGVPAPPAVSATQPTAPPKPAASAAAPLVIPVPSPSSAPQPVSPEPPAAITRHRPTGWPVPAMVIGAVLLLVAGGAWIVSRSRSGRG
ncbi:MAG: S8 family serine peptidase [Egibacteraceae bacterium]